MLDSLITSKTRIKLLLKFFLNPGTGSYLRELAQEFGESTNSIRVELNRLTEADLLESQEEGRTKVYRANEMHPLFPEIQKIVTKTVGLDRLVEQVISRVGNVELAFIMGDLAKGIDTRLIDLVVVGDINVDYFNTLIAKLEKLIDRKIRSLILTPNEFQRLQETLSKEPILVIWKRSGLNED